MEENKKSFEELVVEKIDNGKELTEKELQELVYGFAIDREEGESGRWSKTVISIVRLCNRCFEIIWEEGLTELQENEFYEQPYEVEKHEYEKTITVTEWVKLEK